MHPKKIYYPKPDDFVPNRAFDDGSLRCPGWARTKGQQCGSHPKRGKKACRMHGADAGRPPNPKFILGEHMKGLNRLLDHPNLTDLTWEAAANSAMLERLLIQFATCDSVGASGKIDGLLKRMRTAASFGQEGSVLTILQDIEELRSEERRESQITRKIMAHFKQTDDFVKTMHKMAMDSKAMIPAVHVLEYMQLFQRILFRVIPNAQDRAWVINEMRSYGPEGL